MLGFWGQQVEITWYFSEHWLSYGANIVQGLVALNLTCNMICDMKRDIIHNSLDISLFILFLEEYL